MSSSKHVKTPNKPILFTTTTRSSSGRSTQTNKKAVSSRSDTTNTRQVSQRKKQESGSSLQSSKNKSQSLADSDQEIEKNNKLENIGKIEKPRRNKKATPIEELSPEELSSDNIDPFQLKGSFQQNYDKYNSQSSDLLTTDDLDAKLGQNIRNFFDDNNDNESITYHVKKIKEFTDSMKPVINPENDNIDTLIENLKTRVFEHDKLREENDEILLKNKNLKNQLKEAQQQLSDYIDHSEDDDDTNISNMVKSFYHNRQDFNEYSEILRNDLDLSQKVRNFFNEEDNNDVILNTIQSNKESADDNSRVTELSSQLENLSRNAEIDKIRQINAKYQQEIEEQKEQIHHLKKEASSLYDQINSQKAEIENLNETVESKKKELLDKEKEISEIKISFENQKGQIRKDILENRSDDNYEINDSTIFELTKSYESKLEEIQNELSTKELLYNQLRNDIFQQQTLNDEKQKENMELRKFVENADDIKNKEIAFLKQRLLTELEKQKNLEMSLANGTNDEYTSSLNEQLNNKEIEITSLKNANAKQRSIIEQKKIEISQLDQSLQKQINLLNKENAEQRSIIEQKEKEIIELKKTLDEQNNLYNEIKKSQEEMQKTHEEEELQDNQDDKLNNEQEVDEKLEHQPSVQQNENDEEDQIQDNQNDQTNHNNPEQQSNNEQEEEEFQQEINHNNNPDQQSNNEQEEEEFQQEINHNNPEQQSNNEEEEEETQQETKSKIPEQQSSDFPQDEDDQNSQSNDENSDQQQSTINPIEREIKDIPQLQNDDGNEEELQDYQNELEEEEEENQKTVNDEKPKHQPDFHQDEDDQIQDNQDEQSNNEQEEEEIQQITSDEKSEQQSSDFHQDEDDQIQDNQNEQSNDENTDQQSNNEQEEEETQQEINHNNPEQQSNNEQEEEETQQETKAKMPEQQSSDFPQDEDDQNSQSNDENSDQQQSTINPIEREIKDIDDSQEIDQQKEIVKEENIQTIKEETNNDDNKTNTESINESNQPTETETETTTPTNEPSSTEETSYNVLENYELLKPFAHGAFGKVYKVRDKSTGEIYAAKISKNTIDNDDKTKLNIKREVNILSKLNHPGVLQFICYSPVNFKNEPRPVIITQYAENHTLSDMIKLERESRAHKDWDDTRKLIVLYGIASAMSFLHSNRIIHRDLKPTNILMDEHLHPKIADFGLSKIQHNETIASISQSGIKGTFLYLPPEVFQDTKAYSESSDVYAFGMIAYEVITSQIPFQGLSQNEIILKIQKGERPTIDDNQILPAYKFLIQSCWDQDPSKRPTFSMIVDSLGGDDGFRDFDGFDEDEFLKYVYFIEDCKDKITFDTTPNKDINKYIVSQEKTFKTYTVDIPDKTTASPLEKEEDKQSNKTMCPKEYYEQLDEDRKHLIDEAENDPIKQCIVGQFLVEGIEGFPQETDLGIQYLDKSIEAGCTQACNYYCNLLIRGQFVDYNLELAEKYLEKQLKSHNGTVYLLYGRVMRKFEKFDLAQKYFKKGANLGNNEAMYEYGKMMYRGEGCEKNEKEANVYFDLAKKNGNYKAYEFVFKQQKEEERRRKRNELNS